MLVNINNDDFIRLVNFFKVNYGINLTEKKHLVEGRLNKIIVTKGFNDYSSYLQFAYSNKKELSEMVNLLTTNHTYFLREPEHFEYFKKVILPYLEKTVKDRDLRIWSAASSSGEEAYTLAMIIADYFGAKKALWDTKILATDLSSNVLSIGKKGIYPAEAVEKLPNNWKVKYFIKRLDNTYELIPKIKNEVVFGRFNLMNENIPFKKKFNVIFCRNVMIYFENHNKAKLIERFFNHTEQNGYLIIGLSESLDNCNAKYKFIKPSIFRKELIT